MNKQELLKKYNEEEKLLISKVLDKIKFVKEKNRIETTDFLNMYEQKIIKEILNKIKEDPAPLDESGRQLVKIHVSDDSNFLSPLLHQRSAHVVLRDGRIFGTQYKASASGHAFTY